MSKALFFDIDGTLLSFNTHEVPKSTTKALLEAKQRGHKLFIATGRPPTIINSVGALLPLFDGFVTTNGAFCYTSESIVLQNNLRQETVRFFIDDALRHHYSSIIVSQRDMIVINDTPLLRHIFEEQLNIDVLRYDLNPTAYLDEPIMQISSFFGVDHEMSLSTHDLQCNISRWHPDFIDITATGTDKGIGIAAMARHFGIDIADTIAFGDGGNDAPMLRAAGIGVAMGNASDNTKAAADYVTTDIEDNGISNALRHLNII